MKKILFAYIAMTTSALAHTGQGEAAGHWATQPDHIVGFIVLAVVGGLVLTRLRSRE